MVVSFHFMNRACKKTRAIPVVNLLGEKGFVKDKLKLQTLLFS